MPSRRSEYSTYEDLLSSCKQSSVKLRTAAQYNHVTTMKMVVLFPQHMKFAVVLMIMTCAQLAVSNNGKRCRLRSKTNSIRGTALVLLPSLCAFSCVPQPRRWQKRKGNLRTHQDDLVARRILTRFMKHPLHPVLMYQSPLLMTFYSSIKRFSKTLTPIYLTWEALMSHDEIAKEIQWVRMMLPQTMGEFVKE